MCLWKIKIMSKLIRILIIKTMVQTINQLRKWRMRNIMKQDKQINQIQKMRPNSKILKPEPLLISMIYQQIQNKILKQKKSIQMNKKPWIQLDKLSLNLLKRLSNNQQNNQPNNRSLLNSLKIQNKLNKYLLSKPSQCNLHNNNNSHQNKNCQFKLSNNLLQKKYQMNKR